MLKKISRFTASVLAASVLCFLLSPIALAANNNGEVPIYQACPRPAVQNCKPANTCVKQDSTCVKQTNTCVKQTNTCVKQTNTCVKQTNTCVKQVQTSKPAQNNKAGQSANVSTPANSNYAAEVVRLVNEERAAQGLAPLAMDSTLSAAAQLRGEECSVKFSHTRPNGSSCFSVLKEFGVSYRRAGENIALGQNSPAQVVKAWMDSPGHRANILGDYSKIGVGVLQVTGRGYAWAQFFTK